jgi:hypothetical protein
MTSHVRSGDLFVEHRVMDNVRKNSLSISFKMENIPITNLVNDYSVYIHYGILEILKNEIYNGSLKFIPCLCTAHN